MDLAPCRACTSVFAGTGISTNEPSWLPIVSVGKGLQAFRGPIRIRGEQHSDEVLDDHHRAPNLIFHDRGVVAYVYDYGASLSCSRKSEQRLVFGTAKNTCTSNMPSGVSRLLKHEGRVSAKGTASLPYSYVRGNFFKVFRPSPPPTEALLSLQAPACLLLVSCRLRSQLALRLPVSP